MKTVAELAEALSLTVVNGGDGMNRAVDGGVYCCDLLSIVMGRGPAGGVWVTVMANVNAVAVAVLCDISCVIIAEGMPIDEATINKARAQEVVLLATAQPVFETAKEADQVLHDEP